MNQHISKLALVVKDYDEAIDFYTNKLHFDLLEDTKLSEEKRWVVVRPPGGNGCSLLLAKAKNAEQLASVGNQTGGRVFLFLFTDDLERDYKNLKDNNIQIVREITEEEYGKVTVFADLYGNMWDLIEPSDKNSLFQS